MLSRVACLGQWASPWPLQNNQQKVRIDYLLDVIHGGKRTIAPLTKKYLAFQPIYPLIEQQEALPWLSCHPSQFNLVYMDSYCELVDQKFTHNDGWPFCAYYSDVNHKDVDETDEFKQFFKCDGLLPIEDFHQKYDQFFNWIKRVNPNSKIIFIHFPTVYDQRQKFKDRGNAIIDAVSSVQQKYNIKNIIVPDNIVDHYQGHEDYPSPYHFGPATINYLKDQVRKP